MSIDQLSLVGGRLCLDFVNTVGNHLGDDPGEYLLSYRDLVLWGEHAGGIGPDEAIGLLRQGEEHTGAAEKALAHAIALRETIYRLLLCAVRHQAPEKPDLAALNAAIAAIPARTQVTFDGEKYAWQLPREITSPNDVLWRVLWSAVDLLTSDQLAQVKVCAGDDCGWMFLDTSRNQARRWCSMADCGNRAKANRYYQRHKAE